MQFERYARTSNKDQQILLLGLTKAFGAVNRAALWTSLYKTGLPTHKIPRLRRGRKNTKLQVKRNKQYGAEIDNNLCGCSRIRSKRAQLFSVCTDGAMEDYQALSYNWPIPYRTIKHRTEGHKTKTIRKDIQPEQESNPNMKLNGGNKHNPDKAQSTQKQQKQPTRTNTTTGTR